MLDTLEVVTTVVLGVMVGVEFAVAFVLNRIFDGLPEDANQLGRAHGGRLLGAVMPFWYFASLALVIVWTIARWHGTLITAGALLVVSVLMSVLVLVPINNQSKTWTPENRPADWRRQLKRWDRYHYARVAVLVAAFALVAVAR